MDKEEIGLILESQRKFFATGKTLDVNLQDREPEKTEIADPQP